MTSPSTSSAVTSLAPETLQSWIKEHRDLVVIDVRSAAEFESIHVRGSYNVPLPLLSEHSDELAARLGPRVVLVCQSGVRAEQARQRMATVDHAVRRRRDLGPVDPGHRFGSRRRATWARSNAPTAPSCRWRLSPLPDGATLVTFNDVTDRFRIETALRDRNEGLEAADRLKSDFIKHVSYELRTPAEHHPGLLRTSGVSGVPGALNAQQDEYVQAIVAGGNTLKSLVNDILDLALVESGALRLELERIDLHDLITDVADPCPRMGQPRSA